jgi:hypothetical protein
VQIGAGALAETSNTAESGRRRNATDAQHRPFRKEIANA